MNALKQCLNTATARQVETHLTACGPSYVPPLRDRVDITAYSEKITARAQRFEAWSGDVLIGLVAAYFQTGAARAFVTNVSVLPSWSRLGVASSLLHRCIAYARSLRVEEVVLEVDRDNASAIALYEKIGFSRTGGEGPQAIMTLQLGDKT